MRPSIVVTVAARPLIDACRRVFGVSFIVAVGVAFVIFIVVHLSFIVVVTKDMVSVWGLPFKAWMPMRPKTLVTSSRALLWRIFWPLVAWETSISKDQTTSRRNPMKIVGLSWAFIPVFSAQERLAEARKVHWLPDLRSWNTNNGVAWQQTSGCLLSNLS